jgi:hypothetical protein
LFDSDAFDQNAFSVTSWLFDIVETVVANLRGGAYFVPIKPRKKRKPVEDDEILLTMLL